MRLTKIKKTYLVAAAALAAGAMICLPRFASAAVTGQCSNCHTMHNSQNGAAMTFSAGFGTTGGSATPNDTLLRGNCLQCHTGTNASGGTVPFVYSTTAPTYGLSGDTLAGGNFYWCVNGGTAGADPVAIGGGHDVDMLGVPEAVLISPPGDTDTTSWSTRVSAQADMATGGHLTCAGTAGCHGDRSATNNFSAVHGAHHTDPGGAKDGTTVAKSFRFLNGIMGYEVAGWEYKPTDVLHNGYQGVDRATDTSTDINAATISALCAECHGGFHNNVAGGSVVDPGIQGSGATMASPWIRHPTDYDMVAHQGSGTEYYGYTDYSPMVPVGRLGTPLAAWSTESAVNGGSASTYGAVVMCISCHRPHGSPYADLLRWNYSQVVAGTSNSGFGCFVCHTTKD